VNLLDENIRDDQRVLLRKWRIPFRQVGKEILRSGIQDEELIPFLHGLRSATLFTQDKGFFKRELWHKRYSLVYVDVRYNEVAEFIRRFLGHSQFETQSRRLGVVARIRSGGVQFWRIGQLNLQKIGWEHARRERPLP